MDAPKLADILTGENKYTISLKKLTGQDIADVVGYVSNGFGDAAFKLTRIVMANGHTIDVEGEHDFPYLSLSPANEEINLSQEILDALDEDREF